MTDPIPAGSPGGSPGLPELAALDPFDLVRPRYGGASLADVIPSALAVLGVAGAPDRLGLTTRLAGIRRIGVLLVDGLGWHQIPVAAPYAPTLAELAGYGTPITSGFPSTTPTSLVSLGTGVPPGAHGVLGVRGKLPGDTRILTHTDWAGDPDPRVWQPVRTQWELAAAAGVTVTVLSRPEFAGSGLTEAANRGGAYQGAADPEALAAGMIAALCAGDGPTLVYGYHPDLDRSGHVSGVDSTLWRTAVTGLDRLLDRLVDALPADAALLVTADHGQFNVPAGDRFDLDADPRLSGDVLVAAGEPRVRYLHVRPGAVDDVIATWSAVLGPAARVTTRAEAVAEGWFGPVPEAHLDRIGDVVVTCHGRAVVLASRRAPFEARLVGYHGSCTATEMTVPLLVLTGSGPVRR
ncbi:MAG TPA: nucleotide pyrophosphatase/phosphodiesterase family protein [Micromonospora sp.]